MRRTGPRTERREAGAPRPLRSGFFVLRVLCRLTIREGDAERKRLSMTVRDGEKAGWAELCQCDGGGIKRAAPAAGVKILRRGRRFVLLFSCAG